MAHQPQYVGPEYIQNPMQPLAAGKAGKPQVVTGAGALSLDTSAHDIQASAAGDMALTLAAGDPFQRKTIHLSAKASTGGAVVTAAFASNGVAQTTATFNAVGDFIDLIFLNGKWQVLTNVSVTMA